MVEYLLSFASDPQSRREKRGRGKEVRENLKQGKDLKKEKRKESIFDVESIIS